MILGPLRNIVEFETFVNSGPVSYIEYKRAFWQSDHGPHLLSTNAEQRNTRTERPSDFRQHGLPIQNSRMWLTRIGMTKTKVLSDWNASTFYYKKNIQRQWFFTVAVDL